MRFEPTPIRDVVLVELEPHSDDRGFFARHPQPDDRLPAGWHVKPVVGRNTRASVA